MPTEKKSAEKATTEKPIAEKKLPKESETSDKKKKKAKKIKKKKAVNNNIYKIKKKKSVEMYKIYIFKVLKQVHPDVGNSSKVIRSLTAILIIFENLAQKSSRLAFSQDPDCR
ncbi:hypothetical protein JCGZ_17133 [Jatropha curcas]|uniref:Uncharacterized protein n=1 Tax=Jatropha curcas TaxID=180498 RepID=A0A067KDW2_JATCU|nr:hypothetical protein JCGZ_17133 [Jatropha curcas]